LRHSGDFPPETFLRELDNAGQSRPAQGAWRRIMATNRLLTLPEVSAAFIIGEMNW